MDFWTQHLDDTARHLILMADTPGFRQHAAHRLEELTADPLYRDLPARIKALRATMARADSSPEAPSSSPSAQSAA